VPHYGSYDQANADRFVRGANYRFRRVPAWELWFERRGDVWFSEYGEPAVREAFYDSLAEFSEGERADSDSVAGRRESISQAAQKAALWLLERDSRLWASPEEFEIAGGRLLHPPLPPWDEKTEAAFHKLKTERFFGREAERVSNWVLAARERASCTRAGIFSPSLLLCRHGEGVRDLLGLESLLSELFGSRIVRLGAKTWTEFPESLGPSLALRLTGAQVVVLEGPESMKHFPEVALVRWLLQQEARWFGLDGSFYRLQLPRFFLLGGRPLVNLPYVNSEIGDRMVSVGLEGLG
jgi:hypothetical protein